MSNSDQTYGNYIQHIFTLSILYGFIHLKMSRQLHNLTTSTLSLFLVLLFFRGNNSNYTKLFQNNRMTAQKFNSSNISSCEPFKRNLFKHHSGSKQAKLKACHYRRLKSRLLLSKGEKACLN